MVIKKARIKLDSGLYWNLKFIPIAIEIEIYFLLFGQPGIF